MKCTDEDLVRYADNTISAERRDRLLDAAEHDTELAETLAALDASKLPFKAAFDQQPLPPVPEALRNEVSNLVSVANGDNVTRIDTARSSSGRDRKKLSLTGWPGYLAQAACLILCVGIGFAIGRADRNTMPTDITSVDITSTDAVSQRQSTQSEWVARVADYQTLYVANTVGNVEADLPGTLEKLEKLETLEQTSELRTAVPDLSEAGYQFARAQELGFEGKTLVQVVYTKAGNTPLALCYMVADGERDEHLMIASRHGLGTASWINNNQRFVIVGNEPAEALRDLYRLASTEFTET